jgi:hypothetical protein
MRGRRKEAARAARSTDEQRCRLRMASKVDAGRPRAPRMHTFAESNGGRRMFEGLGTGCLRDARSP